jgi:WD40 repeat protein
VVLDRATGKEHSTRPVKPDEQVLALSSTGAMVAIGYKTLALVDVQTGKPRSSLKGHKHGINAARFSGDDHTIVTASGSSYTPADYTARVWNVEDGKERHKLKGHAGNVLAVTLADAESVVAVDWFGRLIRWSLTTGKPVHDLTPPFAPTSGPSLYGSRDVALSRSGEYVATHRCADDGGPGPTHVWRAADGSVVCEIANAISGVALSDDGRTAAAIVWTEPATWDAVLFDVASGREIARVACDGDTGLAFTPDGSRFLWGNGGALLELTVPRA